MKSVFCVAAATGSAAMEAANHSKNIAMEAENHVQHGANSISRMSRADFLIKAGFVLAAGAAGLVFSGCENEKEQEEQCDEECEERKEQLKELEQLIMDYVETCCTEHSDLHYEEAKWLSDPVRRPDFVRRMHYVCITGFINQKIGNDMAVDGVGTIAQDLMGKVQSGRLTQFSITDLKPGEKVDNDTRRWSTNLINDTNERGRVTDFAIKDKIVRDE